MYASQWFMTAFACPLPATFAARAIDVMVQVRTHSAVRCVRVPKQRQAVRVRVGRRVVVALWFMTAFAREHLARCCVPLTTRAKPRPYQGHDGEERKSQHS
jgi:hypothetical protein